MKFRRLGNILTVTVLILIYSFSCWGYEIEIKEISLKLKEFIKKSGITKIAVVDFTDLQGTPTKLGRFIAEELSVALLGTEEGFEIVERNQLQTLIKEYKLATTGLIEPDSVQKLGQIAGVEALITGAMTIFSDSVRITVKILDVKTARIIGGTVGNIPIVAAIKSLLSNDEDYGKDMNSIKDKTNLSPDERHIVDAGGFIIELQRSERLGKKIIFYFKIMNKREECYFSLNHFGVYSRLYDNLGNEYLSKSAKIGNSSSEIPETQLIPNVPVIASVTFEKIDAQAKYFAMLELACYSRREKNFNIQFRNVDLPK